MFEARGAGNRGQGTGNREQGSGIRDQFRRKLDESDALSHEVGGEMLRAIPAKLKK
jgi:molybdate-binding protein